MTTPAAMAETFLSPQQIEALPFGTSTSATPNTETMMEVPRAPNIEIAPDKKDAGLPQFNTDSYPSQIFWLFASFGILYIFFSRAALPKLSSIIEDRLMTIRGDIEQAEKLSLEAESTKQAYEKAIHDAHAQAHWFINTVTESLRDDDIREAEAFKEKSMAEIERLETQANEAIQNVKSDLATTVTDITADIVEKLTSLKLKQSDVEKTVSTLMTRQKAA